MKVSIFSLIALLVLGLFTLSPLFAEDDEALESYITECNAPKAFYDPAVMAETMADPQKFMSFMTEINKPATTKALAECMAHPEQWSSMIEGMSDYNKYAQAMVPFMNPQTYMNWMVASMNPQTYTPFMTYMNPAFYTQWMTTMMDPTYYQPMFNMMNTTEYTKAFESFYKMPFMAQANIEQ